MLRQEPFAPLKFLERTLRLHVHYSKRGIHIVLDGLAALAEEKQRQAQNVVRSYPRLLELQLDAPKGELRPSVRKLLAQGKVETVDGRYRVRVKQGC